MPHEASSHSEHLLQNRQARMAPSISVRLGTDVWPPMGGQAHFLERLRDGVVVVGPDRRIAFFNDGYLVQFGLKNGDIRVGDTLEDVFRMLAQRRKLGANPGETPDQVVARRLSDWHRPEMPVERRPMENGRVLDIYRATTTHDEVISVHVDVTDLVRAEDLRREADLLEARAMGEQTIRQRTDLVARMSHEMRTPLNGILGVAALLRRTQLDARQGELLDTIASSGAVLLRLIDDILDLSRLEAGPFKAVVEDIEIGCLIDECVAIVEPAAAEKGLALRRRSPPDPLPRLSGDAVRLKQIVLNLLTNAVKFTEAGHVEVAVAGVEAAGGVSLAIEVADTGVGIPPDCLDRIFESFYQIDSASTRKSGGAGLGLAIARGLVQGMGGTITVASEPGVGTVFRVRLTLPRAHCAQAS